MEHADAPPAKQRRLRVNGTGQDREGVGSGGLYHPYPILTIPSLSHPYPTPIPSCPSTDYLPAPSTSFLSHHLLLTTTSATYYLLPPLTHSPLSLSLLSVLCFLCAPSLSHPYPIPIPSLILSLSHPYPIPIPSLFISLSHSYPIPILSLSYPYPYPYPYPVPNPSLSHPYHRHGCVRPHRTRLPETQGPAGGCG